MALTLEDITNFLSGSSGLLSTVGGGLATKEAYDRLGGIGEAAQQGSQVIAQQGLEQTKFQPFTVTSTTGSNYGYDPVTGQVTMGLSPSEQALSQQLLGQANQMFGQPAQGQAQLARSGLGLLGTGQQLMGQPTFGMGATQGASQQAFGLGNQFMGAAGRQPADINQLRGQFANQVGGLLTQQPNQQISQLGSQALGLGMSGLNTQAPQDIEALRSQYGSLASQAASDVLMPTANRESDVYGRIRATQRPEEERQRMALEERLAAQGRLGVGTNMYGGTPEQLALSKAQEEAKNTASLMALQQAQAEQQQALGTAQTLGGMFGQQAGLSSDIQSQAQQRASQLAGLGLSANQIESQLQSEGLGRAATAASQTGSLAQLSGNLQAQQAGLGSQFASLGAGLAGQQQALDAARQQQALQALTSGQGLLAGGLGLQQLQQQLGTGALGAAYLPQSQLLNAQQASQLFPQLQQRGQLSGAGLFGEASMGGLEALLGSGLGQANLMGQIGSGLLTGSLSPNAQGQTAFGDGLGSLVDFAENVYGSIFS